MNTRMQNSEDPTNRYDEINERLKEFAQLCNQSHKVVEDYKTYYENKATEVTNIATRMVQEACDEKLASELKSTDKFRETMHIIAIMKKELSIKSKKQRIMSECWMSARY